MPSASAICDHATMRPGDRATMLLYDCVTMSLALKFLHQLRRALAFGYIFFIPFRRHNMDGTFFSINISLLRSFHLLRFFGFFSG